MQKLLNWLNDQHWYLVAIAVIAAAIFWTYGCESQVRGLLDPNQQINRAELQNELDFIIGQARIRAEDLDRQDAVKQALLDAANLMATSGTINPSGLINLAACIGAISFGLNRNQKYKAELMKKST